jgi:hypothetical protein
LRLLSQIDWLIGGTLQRTLEYCDFHPEGQIMNEQIKSDEIEPALTASEAE